MSLTRLMGASNIQPVSHNKELEVSLRPVVHNNQLKLRSRKIKSAFSKSQFVYIRNNAFKGRCCEKCFGEGILYNTKCDIHYDIPNIFASQCYHIPRTAVTIMDDVKHNYRSCIPSCCLERLRSLHLRVIEFHCFSNQN